MTPGAIGNVHRAIAREIRQITTVNCRIVPLSESAVDTKFVLGAVPGAPAFEFVDRARGGRAPVIPLFPPQDFDTPTIWLSWYERWQTDGEATIKNASATFYWGISNRPRKQLLRAEWDALDTLPNSAGQPHWQVDTELTGEQYTAQVIAPLASTNSALIELPATEVATELVELTVTALHEISLSRLHLAMGGWRNATTYPHCWRHDIATDGAALSAWATRTLRHAADQFKLLTTVPI